MGRTKTLTSIAAIGFLIGVLSYFLFGWISTTIVVTPIQIMDVVLAPWFLSGIAGSAISLGLVFLMAYLPERS